LAFGLGGCATPEELARNLREIIELLFEEGAPELEADSGGEDRPWRT